MINVEESAHKMLKTFCKIIQQSAKENIPRGKPCKYKPFWTQELNEQKKIRDRCNACRRNWIDICRVTKGAHTDHL